MFNDLLLFNHVSGAYRLFRGFDPSYELEFTKEETPAGSEAVADEKVYSVSSLSDVSGVAREIVADLEALEDQDLSYEDSR